jgi:DNA-directed RNA polymerase subunit M/transcription elongation factor TFIIS
MMRTCEKCLSLRIVNRGGDRFICVDCGYTERWATEAQRAELVVEASSEEETMWNTNWVNPEEEEQGPYR